MKLRAFVLALIAWAVLSTPVLAAWSVTNLASNGNASAATATTMTTSSITIPANTLGIVGGLVRRNASTPAITVSDNAGNNWTVIQCQSSEAFAPWQTFVAYFRYGGTGLSSGTVTATDTVGGTFVGAAMSTSYATGHLTAGTVEDSAGRGCPGTPNGTSTSPSVTSGAATASGNLAFGITARFGSQTGFSYTADTTHGWASLGTQGTSGVIEQTAYAVNPAAAAITLNPTTNNVQWTQQIVQFFAAPTATGNAARCSLLGAGRC